MGTLLILKSKEWFDKNAFEDDSGDYFKSEEEYNAWDEADFGPGVTYVMRGWLELDYIDLYDRSSDFTEETWDWAIEKNITEETNPEYFL